MTVDSIGYDEIYGDALSPEQASHFDALGVEWRGRHIKEVCEDIQIKAIQLAALNAPEKLPQIKTLLDHLVEKFAEVESEEPNPILTKFDPVTGTTRILIAAEKKKRWWKIAIIVVAVVATVATAGAAAAAAAGAGAAAAATNAPSGDKRHKDEPTKPSTPQASSPPPPEPSAPSQHHFATPPTQSIHFDQPTHTPSPLPSPTHFPSSAPHVTPISTSTGLDVYKQLPTAPKVSPPISHAPHDFGHSPAYEFTHHHPSPIPNHPRPSESPVQSPSPVERTVEAVKEGGATVASSLLHGAWEAVGVVREDLGRAQDRFATHVLDVPSNKEQEAKDVTKDVHAKIDEVFDTNLGSQSHFKALPVASGEIPLPAEAFALLGRVGPLGALEANAARAGSVATEVMEDIALTERAGALSQEVNAVRNVSQVSGEAKIGDIAQKQIIKNGPTTIETIAENINSDKIKFFEKNLKHIFRNDPGHLADSPINRQLLIDTASNPKNYLGKDKFGNEWYAKELENGTQSWTQVFEGEIRNGGLNQVPRNFDSVIIPN